MRELIPGGEKINLTVDEIESINKVIKETLDDRFEAILKTNISKSMENMESFTRKYPSLEPFVPKSPIQGNTIVNEESLIKESIKEKGRLETVFWTRNGYDTENEEYDETEDCQKLLNSSLQIYVKHRERILEKYHKMIQLYGDEGEEKHELENRIHNLLLRRGVTLDKTENINHLHNLWILDDKYTIFSNDFKAISSKQGKESSDIYFWFDNPSQVRQVLILELKSTTKAHNAGAMINQVKKYAKQFYNKPTSVLNWDVDTKRILYTGIILARKSDINKEITSNGSGTNFKKIPFLQSSYYNDENFFIDDNPDNREAIRIELYAVEDIDELAYSRNNVFFKLLKNEYRVNGKEEDVMGQVETDQSGF